MDTVITMQAIADSVKVIARNSDVQMLSTIIAIVLVVTFRFILGKVKK